MKTDPFDDAIRRKLEGVNPPFQEKSWTQFQRFMGSQGFPPSLWQTPTRWLQPALMAAAVTGVIISTIWQYRTTQSLTEHVLTLTKTVERMERVQTRLQESLTAKASVPARVDTVYVTRSTQSGSMPVRPPEAYAAPAESYRLRSTRRQVTDEPLSAVNERIASVPMARSERGSGQRAMGSGVTSRVVSSGDQLVTGQATDAPTKTTGQRQSANDPMAARQPQSDVEQPTAGRPVLSANPTTRQQPDYLADRPGTVPLPPETGRAITRRNRRAGTLQNDDQPATNQSTQSTSGLPRSNEPTLYATPVTNQANSAPSAAVNPAITATGPLATVQPLTPLAMPDPAEAFTESWQRHLRRVRYRSPYMTSTGPTVVAAEPASPAQHTTPLPIQFRLGVGGELGTAQSGQGIYAEAILANRLTISTGISQMYWAGDEYQTEQLFTAKTKRDFRHEYPGTNQPMPIGPSRPPQVMNISRAAQSLVVPLQFGYRFNLGEHYVLTPSLGLNLSLTPRETANFQYEPMMFRDEIRKTLTVDRPTAWYSSVVVGVGAERQWGRFVGQVGSLAMTPLRQSPGSLNSLSLGLRGRIFYQF